MAERSAWPITPQPKIANVYVIFVFGLFVVVFVIGVACYVVLICLEVIFF